MSKVKSSRIGDNQIECLTNILEEIIFSKWGPTPARILWTGVCVGVKGEWRAIFTAFDKKRCDNVSGWCQLCNT